MSKYIWTTEDTLRVNNEDGTHSFVKSDDLNYLQWLSKQTSESMNLFYNQCNNIGLDSQ